MRQSPKEPPVQPDLQEVDQPDGKVVRLMPRRRPESERIPDPSDDDDDDDPGPTAA